MAKRPVDGITGPASRAWPRGHPSLSRDWVACLLLVLVVACGGAQQHGRYESSGRPIFVNLDSIQDGIVPRQPEGRAVVAQAGFDFDCSRDRLVVHAIQSWVGGEDGAYRVEGCGRSGIYEAVRLYGWSSLTPGHRGTVENVDVRRYIRLSSKDEMSAALTVLDRQAESLQLVGRFGSVYNTPRVGQFHRDVLFAWADFAEAAAGELSCPRDLVTVVDDPEWIEETSHVKCRHHHCPPKRYVAEGCGCKSVIRRSHGAFIFVSRAATEWEAQARCPPPAGTSTGSDRLLPR